MNNDDSGAERSRPVRREPKRRRGNGEGSIRLRSDGRWEARLPPEHRGGKMKRRSFISRDRAKVVRWLNEALVAQCRGTLLEGSPITLEAFIRRHYLPMARLRLRRGSYADYERRLEHYVIPRIGRV